MLDNQKQELKKIVKGVVLFGEPMKKHTSFCIGGPAVIFIIPADKNDLNNILNFANSNNIQINIIGNGTNLLVSDDGVAGITIKISSCFDDVIVSGQKIVVGAGYSLSELSKLVANYGLSGLEFAVGIPGTVGGAVVMNAGAHGGAMADVVTKVLTMNFEGKTNELSKDNLVFGYRKSKLQNDDAIVLEVEMELKKGDTAEIKKRMVKYLEWRKKNQPINIPNAGSIFKNPKNDYAGRLIDIAGCKGIRIGDAQVSELKANFIVNRGNASAKDVLTLIERVSNIVKLKCGIKLESEVKIIGR